MCNTVVMIQSITSPVWVPGLSLHKASKVNLLGEHVGLSPGVADVAIGVELFRNPHCLLGIDSEFSWGKFFQLLINEIKTTLPAIALK